MQPEQANTLHIEAGGSQTTVFTYGPEDGPTVLAVHGFRGTHYGLEPLAEALACHGYRVLVPDLPGTGASSPLRGTHNAVGYGAWLNELAEQLPQTKLLLGHSFGSVIVSAAIAHGTSPDGAVLVNPILEPPLTGPRRIVTAAASAYYALARHLPPGLGHRLLASRLIAGIGGTLMTSTEDRALRKWIRDEHLRQAGAFASRDVVLQSFIASTTNTVTDFAAHFTAPTLLLGADRDPLSPLSAHAVNATGIRTGAFHVFPDRGHLLPYEETEKLSQLIADWDESFLRGARWPGARSAAHAQHRGGDAH